MSALVLERAPEAAPEFARIVATPGVCGGSACLVRTRIPVWTLESLRRQGADDAELLAAYPALDAFDLAHARAYVAARPAEIDAAIRRNGEACALCGSYWTRTGPWAWRRNCGRGDTTRSPCAIGAGRTRASPTTKFCAARPRTTGRW